MLHKTLLTSCLAFAGLVVGCSTTTGTDSVSKETVTASHTGSKLSFVDKHELVNRSEVVAVVHSSDSAINLERKAARWGYGLKRKEDLTSVGYQLLTFDCPPGIDPHVAARELENMESFVTVEVNHKYTLQSAKMPSLDVKPKTYANELVNWPEDGCEAVVPIGIIDGAIATDSASLRHANIIGKSFVAPNEQEAEAEHGTAIAELLVGRGRLKNTQLYSASVIAQERDGTQYAGIGPLLKAIDWQVKSGAKIINISLAGPYNKTLERVIDRATAKGTIIVASSGLG